MSGSSAGFDAFHLDLRVRLRDVRLGCGLGIAARARRLFDRLGLGGGLGLLDGRRRRGRLGRLGAGTCHRHLLEGHGLVVRRGAVGLHVVLLISRSAVEKTHLNAVIRMWMGLSFTCQEKIVLVARRAELARSVACAISWTSGCVIVTGKGGVGKSTVALALGVASAERGKRTIVAEVSAQEQLSRVFHRAQVGFHEVEMAENLWGISIDPDEAMREYVLLQLKVKAMRDLLFRSRSSPTWPPRPRAFASS